MLFRSKKAETIYPFNLDLVCQNGTYKISATGTVEIKIEEARKLNLQHLSQESFRQVRYKAKAEIETYLQEIANTMPVGELLAKGTTSKEEIIEQVPVKLHFRALSLVEA